MHQQMMKIHDENVPFCPTENAQHKPPRIHNKKNPTQKKELGGKGKGKGKARAEQHTTKFTVATQMQALSTMMKLKMSQTSLMGSMLTVLLPQS